MKIYRAEIDLKVLPNTGREILEKLKTERNLAVKGGLSRLALLHNMERVGKAVDRERMGIEDRIKDIDVVVFHSQSLSKSREYLLEKEKELKGALSDIVLDNGIRFDGRDIEPVRGSLKTEYRAKTLTKVLRTRDLTFNEVVLIPEDSRWIAYYSPRCWRDLIEGVGMLTSGGWKTVRYDSGRMLPTNYGFFRLLRFWVEGKVKKIWLPSWMVKIHLKEMNRLQKEGVLPEGANLGRYSRIIANQYKSAEPELKRRWMIVLNYLGFTDLLSFDTFMKEQELLDILKHQEEFSFEDDIPLSEIIEKTLIERKKKQKDREMRKARMMNCRHKFVDIECDGCGQHCKIRKCSLCNYVEKQKEFKCNLIFQTGDWRRDINSLIAFPYRKRTRQKTRRTKQISSRISL
ncbi:MAG TPA: hypothetical protein ENF31_00395 [bacterium]|nr:hypothetical protein [bacterium]